MIKFLWKYFLSICSCKCSSKIHLLWDSISFMYTYCFGYICIHHLSSASLLFTSSAMLYFNVNTPLNLVSLFYYIILDRFQNITGMCCRKFYQVEGFCFNRWLLTQINNFLSFFLILCILDTYCCTGCKGAESRNMIILKNSAYGEEQIETWAQSTGMTCSVNTANIQPHSKVAFLLF